MQNARCTMKTPKWRRARGLLFGFGIVHCALCICAAGAFGVAHAAEPATPAIRADQIGYQIDAPKLAIVVSSAATTFAVHRVSDGANILEADLSESVHHALSGDDVRTADFSAVTEAGTYEIRVAGGRSWPFAISESPYGELLRLTMRSYYGQRCGTAVDLGGGYAHPACHRKGAFHRSAGPATGQVPTGGWHDAGDYGRYVVNSGITVGTLLWAFELFPGALTALDLAIPESGNSVPDILDEVRWNLEWMLAMQDADGGVWPKQTSEQFPPFVAPHRDGTTSFVIGSGRRPYKSSCATADLAAAAAIAARVYRPHDADLADRAQAAAERAWSWLERHPNATFANPLGVGTGAYGDANCLDERLWAAAELWRSTGEKSARAFFMARAEAAIRAIVADEPPDWRDVGALAGWTYVLGGNGDPEREKAIIARTVRAADAIAARAMQDGWRTPMVEENYVWGSNGVAANYALQLLVANAIRPTPAYTDAAREIVHYLLGRNAVGISWVTGAGPRATRNPHHRPSGSDAIDLPWPGLLAGGPDRERRDPLLKRLPSEMPPAKLYLDEQESFAGNEVAINWNAALVFVLAGLQDR